MNISDANLYAAYKKLEIELEKEKKKSHGLEREVDKLLQENSKLKEKATNTISHSEHHKSSIVNVDEKLKRKDEEITHLKAELKHTIEGTRLVSEHSNKVISENAKHKEQMEDIINGMNSDREKLEEELRDLKTKIKEYALKAEVLQERSEILEQQLNSYTNKADILEQQLLQKDEAFSQLAQLNSEYETILKDLSESPVHEKYKYIQPHINIPTKTTEKQDIIHNNKIEPLQREQVDYNPSYETKSKRSSTHREDSIKQNESISNLIQDKAPIVSHEPHDNSVRFESEENENTFKAFQTTEQEDNHAQPEINYFQKEAFEQEKHVNEFSTQSQPDENDKPPMGFKSTTSQNNTNNQNLFLAPAYRMPQKKKEDSSKRQAPFTPQNVQIISGKNIDNDNPLNETEEDQQETPRRENASNASTPTKEESMKH